MIYSNFPINIILLLIQNQEDIMRMNIEKKFASIFLKNTVQSAWLKKENVEIVKIYLLNIREIVINFLLNNNN